MHPSLSYKFVELTIGQTAEFCIVLTDDMVCQFSALSGDFNPLHMDETFAQATMFGGRIAHGQLGVSFFSQLIGMHLPGTHALYLSQTTRFKNPMRIGMQIRVQGEVIQKTEALHSITIRTQIIDSAEEKILIDGEALVKMLQ